MVQTINLERRRQKSLQFFALPYFSGNMPWIVQFGWFGLLQERKKENIMFEIQCQTIEWMNKISNILQ